MKDVALVASLLIAIGGCWLAYVQHKYSQSHLKKVMKDLDTLQRAEDALLDLQKKWGHGSVISLLTSFVSARDLVHALGFQGIVSKKMNSFVVSLMFFLRKVKWYLERCLTVLMHLPTSKWGADGLIFMVLDNWMLFLFQAGISRKGAEKCCWREKYSGTEAKKWGQQCKGKSSTALLLSFLLFLRVYKISRKIFVMHMLPVILMCFSIWRC